MSYLLAEKVGGRLRAVERVPGTGELLEDPDRFPQARLWTIAYRFQDGQIDAATLGQLSPSAWDLSGSKRSWSERHGFATLLPTWPATCYAAPQFRAHLLTLLEDGHINLAVDLDGLDFMDSSGLGVVVAAKKRARDNDCDMRGPPARSRPAASTTDYDPVMLRFSFHPKRCVASLLIVPAMMALLVAVAIVLPQLVSVVFILIGFGLVGALLILPAWVMQPRGTPPPRGRGRHTEPIQLRPRMRSRERRPPTDLAARWAHTPA